MGEKGIDEVQSKQIQDLEKKDISHDRELFFYRAFGVMIILGFIAMFAFIMENLKDRGPYSCPHADCVHHVREIK